MKRRFSLSICTFLCVAASAQSPEVLRELRERYDVVYPYAEDGIIQVIEGGRYNMPEGADNGKYGYVDTLGQIIVAPAYDYGRRFHNGFAGVERAGKWGAVDRRGREIVPAKWDCLENFEEGVAIGAIGRPYHWRYSLIDTAGRITPIKYDYCAKRFSCGLAVVGKGTYEADLSQGIPKGLTAEDMLQEFKGKHGYIKPDGRLAIPLQYDAADDFSENGLAPVGMQGKYYNKWGFIDTTGRMVIPCNYFYAGQFYRGRAVVGKVMPGGKLRYGYIDDSGRTVIPLRYDMASNFDFANTWVGADGGDGETRYWLIDRNGKQVLSFPVYRLQDGGKYGHAAAAVRDKTGALRYGIVANSGRILVPFEYDSIDIFTDLDTQTLEACETAVVTQDGRKFRLEIRLP